MDSNTLTIIVLGLIILGFIILRIYPYFKKAAKLGKVLFSKIYLNKNSTLTADQYKKVALGAIYSEQQTTYINSLTTGGTEFDEILGQWWGIQDRGDAISKLDYLRDKGFRFYFPVVYKAFFSPAAEQDQILADAYPDEEDQETADSQLEFLKETVGELKEGKIIDHESDLLIYGNDGWDYGRLVYLTRLCYDAGYITEDEAWVYINAANDLARRKFNSWESFAKSYVIGRGMWGGPESANAGIMDIAAYLLKLPESPWVKMPW